MIENYDLRAISKDTFDMLVAECEAGGAMVIESDGRPVAVLIGIEEFDRLRGHLNCIAQEA